jgi:hypothetical protein
VTIAIRGGVELPAFREDVELRTADGLTLVGELALPETADPVATLVCLHPLPTHGGRPGGAALQLPRGHLAARHE